MIEYNEYIEPRPDDIEDMIPPTVSEAFVEAYQRSWCLKQLILDTANGDDDAQQYLYECSGYIYSQRAPRNGFACFSEGCNVVLHSPDIASMSVLAIPTCKYPDTELIAGEVVQAELES